MKFYIQAHGITNTEPPTEELPNRNEVEFCKDILKLVKETPNIYRKGSSYGYKHILERNYENNYIANGSFIQAAKELNMDIERISPTSPNAFFKFNESALNLAIVEYFSKKQSLTLDEKIVFKIKEQLDECRVKTPKTSLSMIQQLYKQYNVDVSIKDLFLIVKDTEAIIKYNWSLSGCKISKDDNLGDEAEINVSFSKLAKILYKTNEKTPKVKM